MRAASWKTSWLRAHRHSSSRHAAPVSSSQSIAVILTFMPTRIHSLLERGVIAYAILGLLGGATAAALGCLLGTALADASAATVQPYQGRPPTWLTWGDFRWGMFGGILGLVIG